MAAGDRVIDDDGNVGIDASGNRATFNASGECSACCGACVEAAPANACGNCDDLTPNQYTVTFSGVTACGCFTKAGNDAKVTFLSDVNAAVTVNKTAGGTCEWTGSVGSVKFQVFSTSDASCNDINEIASTTEAATVTLTRNATTWDLKMQIAGGQLFCDTQTANVSSTTQLCATVPTFTNDITTCGNETCIDVLGDFDLSTGGTATVVCVEA